MSYAVVGFFISHGQKGPETFGGAEGQSVPNRCCAVLGAEN